ncbi:MAG: MFS transporter [Phycisphaerae bacterium]|nr:MFS transporter [Phycisphaerae bacterium]
MCSSASDIVPQSALSYARAGRTESYSLPRVVSISVLTFGCMVPVTMLVAGLKELVGDRFDAHPFWSHAFMSINMIGAILAGPIIGLLADSRYPRRVIATLALGTDAILLSLLSFAPNLTIFMILRFVEGAAHILALSTLMALASRWSGPQRRGQMMGIVGAFMMFGTACGTRLGGVVWMHLHEYTFHVAAMISATMGFLAFLIVAEPPREPTDVRRTGLCGLIREQPRLLVAYLYAFIDRFCVGVVITTFGLFLADVHGMDPSERSRTLVRFLLPFAALVYPAGWLVDRLGRVWTISLGSIGFGILFSMYGLASPAQLSVLMILSGVLSAVMFAPNLTLCADLAPAHQRGSAFTGFNVAGSLGFIFGPLSAGTIYSVAASLTTPAAAYESTFFFTGSLEVLCGLVTLPLLLRLKRQGVTR